MYVIEIKRIEYPVKKRREWKLVSETGDGDGRDRKYDYVDDEWPQREETVLLLQNTAALDLAKVIKAINDL